MSFLKLSVIKANSFKNILRAVLHAHEQRFDVKLDLLL